MSEQKETVFIDSLEMENVKRIKAVRIDCRDKPFTIIGGRNKQGKTSFLDGLAFLFGGEKFRPTNLQRDDSLAYPELKATLSNGFVVERKGKNCSLKVTDPSGAVGGQQLLKEFIHQFALDLPKFLHAKPTEKADILLQIIGVGDELKVLEGQEKKAYNERLAYGQIADQKQKYADELVTYPDAPEVPITATELIQSQQAILVKNGENQKLRETAGKLKEDYSRYQVQVADLEQDLEAARQALKDTEAALAIANKTVEQLQDESTQEIEKKLEDIDATNVQVRANMDKEKANEEAEEHKAKYDEMTQNIEAIRAKKRGLLDDADLPLPGLSVENGELTYKGKAWDCMAGSEQLCVSTAIVRKLSPKCGFVLIDKLEALDLESLNAFRDWLEKENIRPIATRVSLGEECSLIIEDGFSVKDGQKTFVRGEF